MRSSLLTFVPLAFAAVHTRAWQACVERVQEHPYKVFRGFVTWLQSLANGAVALGKGVQASSHQRHVNPGQGFPTSSHRGFVTWLQSLANGAVALGTGFQASSHQQHSRCARSADLTAKRGVPFKLVSSTQIFHGGDSYLLAALPRVARGRGSTRRSSTTKARTPACATFHGGRFLPRS